MSYLLDCWYMAGWAEELDHRGVAARVICDIPIVLFRGKQGVAAMVDTCPHRFAPLSRGRLVDGALQCNYHGLTFGAGGQCVHNPHGPIARTMRVRAFPAVEKYHAIWIWMGAPECADPALLPDLSFLDIEPERLVNRGGYIHGKGNYLLYVDNLMDLSHVDFLHTETLGRDSLGNAQQEIEEDARSLTVRWQSRNPQPQPLEIATGAFVSGMQVDRHTEVQWYPPASLRLTVSMSLPGNAPDVRSVAHMLTPETQTTAHYFYASTPNSLNRDPEYNRQIGDARARVFNTEDSPMIEAVQTRMGAADLFSLRPLLLRTDQAAVRVRRRLAALIAQQTPAQASQHG